MLTNSKMSNPRSVYVKYVITALHLAKAVCMILNETVFTMAIALAQISGEKKSIV